MSEKKSRSMVRLLGLATGLLIAASPAMAAHEAASKIVLSAPGPRNISYLPIDLIPAIGADREEGVSLQILHTGGGAVALNNLVTKNADFAVAGVPAAMSLKASGGDVVVIAPVDDAPLFVLMVRSALKDKVKRIADLKGKVIGVNTSTKGSKTTSQQLAELLLKSGGVRPNSVRIVPAGQSWAEQSSLMISGQADAVVGDEPFASRLLTDKRVFFLAHLAQPETVKGIVGANFLHAALETRSDVIAKEPAKVAKMVRMVKKSLAWIASHTPEQVADALGVKEPEERAALLLSLNKYPKTFSRDGKFSTAQLKETDIFFHSSLEQGDAGLSLSIEQMLDDRWAGRGK
ncbi:MAG: ABC transporter substrate-binding protein [Sulfuritalea sp.]|jgi:NitT/TauT family transport system substrate-binding protein|nr:ABC transporter substrate-binding protein [Sulfuritalea sp.]